MPHESITKLKGLKQLCEGLAKSGDKDSNRELFYLLSSQLDEILSTIKAA